MIALAVMIATDEAFSTAGMRIARLCAFAPALSALGAGAIVGHASERGELRALLGLGASPFRTALGAIVAGWVIGAIAVIVLASPFADASSLFPAVETKGRFVVSGGSLIQPELGVVVSPHGAIDLLSTRSEVARAFAPGRGAALWAVAPLALIAPVWICAPARAATRGAVAVVSLALVVLLLHAVAAGRVPAPLLAAAALPLAAHAAYGHLGLSLR